jgi:PAS domain S-box-containing protein
MSSTLLAEQFRTIAELRGDAAWIVDCASGLPTYISESVEAMLGYPPSAFKAQLAPGAPASGPLAAICGGLAERLRRHAEGDASRVRLVRQFELQTPKGGTVAVEVISALIPGPAGKPASLVGAIRDLTGQRALADAQRRFASMLNHEFRTPLSTIDGAIQRLEVTGAHADEATRQRYRKIGAAVDRMIAMLDEYLSPDRLDATGHKARDHAADPRQLLEEGAALARAAGRAVAVDAHTLPRALRCEPDGLRLAIKVMVENAVMYSDAGAPIALLGREAEGGIELLVRDEGSGIRTDDLDRIFDKFYRGGNAAGLPGSGLGLYMARTVADAHGGTLTVRNRDPRGAEFRLWLPVKSGFLEKGCT